jgi:hypothetical protein
MKTRFDVKFAFEVGTIEKHEVSFHWGQWSGDAHISVDGVPVLDEKHVLGLGADEVHAVVIEKTKPRVASGIRKQSFKAFVDGELVGEH